MYTEYWELEKKPFENTPNAEFFYHSPQHEEALARMIYVVHERKGAAVLTGDYGCGKTLLSRVLRDELQQENLYQSVNIIDPRLTGIEFIQEVVYQLTNRPAPQSKIELTHTLYDQLLANYKAGRHTVIVIDEAQSIKNIDIFEELRLLLNFQLDNAFLLTAVLMGSPDLQQMILNLPHLDQRMSVKYHLTSLNEAETRQYILHRLKIARAKRQVFHEDAFREIFLSSHGIPRRINNICDLSLLDGFSNDIGLIRRDIIQEIVKDFQALGSQS